MSAKNKSKNNIGILQEKLQKIKDRDGIIGYIFRSPDSASIDLKDPTKIIDYAVLSTTAFEAGQNMSDMFEIGEVDTILLEGENTKILSRVANNHRLSVFMEKNVDHNKLCKDLNLT
jgi:predicted regulator of Ras-like GTPase activity (Roadblock/LC7/MglB family)